MSCQATQDINRACSASWATSFLQPSIRSCSDWTLQYIKQANYFPSLASSDTSNAVTLTQCPGACKQKMAHNGTRTKTLRMNSISSYKSSFRYPFWLPFSSAVLVRLAVLHQCLSTGSTLIAVDDTGSAMANPSGLMSSVKPTSTRGTRAVLLANVMRRKSRS